MSAKDTLDKIYADMAHYDPQERAQIEDLVDKLEQLCERYPGYSSSPQLAICIVGLKIGASKGQ